MTDTLAELKNKIDAHFRNEAELIGEILKANLTEEELNDLTNYMRKHPISELNNLIEEKISV